MSSMNLILANLFSRRISAALALWSAASSAKRASTSAACSEQSFAMYASDLERIQRRQPVHLLANSVLALKPDAGTTECYQVCFDYLSQVLRYVFQKQFVVSHAVSLIVCYESTSYHLARLND